MNKKYSLNERFANFKALPIVRDDISVRSQKGYDGITLFARDYITNRCMSYSRDWRSFDTAAIDVYTYETHTAQMLHDSLQSERLGFVQAVGMLFRNTTVYVPPPYAEHRGEYPFSCTPTIYEPEDIGVHILGSMMEKVLRTAEQISYETQGRNGFVREQFQKAANAFSYWQGADALYGQLSWMAEPWIPTSEKAYRCTNWTEYDMYAKITGHEKTYTHETFDLVQNVFRYIRLWEGQE